MTVGNPIGEIIDSLEMWAKSVTTEIGTSGVYLFGSLIHKDGAQFGPQSDVDLVVVVPEGMTNAYRRAEWLRALQQKKHALEVGLTTPLKRTEPQKQICSIVAVTTLELKANIHKDGAGGFFTENQFRDLLAKTECRGIPTAGGRSIDERLATECLRFVQKKRNVYLGISAGGSVALTPFSDGEPLPKDIARHAAMARQLTDPVELAGAEYDTQRGLDFVSHTLYEVHRRQNQFTELHDKLSVRRGARGQVPELSPDDQVLLCEVVFSVVAQHLIDLERKKAAEEPSLRGKHSTVLFAERMAQAFPGVRGVKWYTEPQAIKERLERLLAAPLVFTDGTPIWWWRGHANLQIESFQDIGDGVFLMDGIELRISKIAAIAPGPYNRSFVYVEAASMPPTGLYENPAERIAEVERGDSYFPYAWEEFGLVDGTHLITRGQFDDGAAEIGGTLQDIRGRNEVRSRYLTPYNFLVAAHGSPINNGSFDERADELLNLMLKGQDRLNVLMDEVLRLPLRDR
jgi:predicted nucleotidyltransferase